MSSAELGCPREWQNGKVTETLGVYISVPFCKAKCTYCNFASGVHGAGEHARYIERVCAELRSAGQFAASVGAELPRVVESVYLGGGTPSLLAPELLRELFACLREEFAVAAEAEITIECAPGQVSGAFLQAMLEVGVSRVSLGVQSFVDAEARATGRSHTGASALAEDHAAPRGRCDADQRGSHRRPAGADARFLGTLAGDAGRERCGPREPLHAGGG